LRVTSRGLGDVYKRQTEGKTGQVLQILNLMSALVQNTSAEQELLEVERSKKSSEK
jgi:hypothetical protein